MKKLFLPLLFALIALGSLHAHAAGPTLTAKPTPPTPVIMVLEYEENGKRVQTKVEAKRGSFAIAKGGKTMERVRILPGNPLQLEAQPGNIQVDFFQGEAAARVLLCSISVRYFRDERGLWIPHFLLGQEIQAMRTPDGRIVPIDTPKGSQDLMMLSSSALPNLEGFHPWLELGLTIGRLHIDSWTIP